MTLIYVTGEKGVKELKGVTLNQLTVEQLNRWARSATGRMVYAANQVSGPWYSLHGATWHELKDKGKKPNVIVMAETIDAVGTITWEELVSDSLVSATALFK